MIERFFASIGGPIVNSFSLLEKLGLFFTFHLTLFPKYFLPPYRFGLILKQIESLGIQSIGVILLTGFFTGMVLAIQMYQGFHQFGAESVMGYTIMFSIGRELGPVFTGLMLISRAVSAMAAELGTMRVTEQIDAIDILSVDSKRYLIVPRVIAMAISMPILILFFDVIANIASYLLATNVLGVNPTQYMDVITQYLKFSDFATGILKGFVFGGVIAAIGSYIGYYTNGGAKGVGVATTKAVVIASVALFLTNYLMSSLFLFVGW
jgi:phospholipid/cholesterol/gamma-HCH transport system permease protein